MKKYRSPNFNDRTEDIKYLILHYTGMATATEALERLCDVKAAVSAHYLIEENGKIHSLVDEHKRAWHAGLSEWEGEQDINNSSIGIELANTGHPYPGYESVYKPFPNKQMSALIELAKDIVKRYSIKPCYVLGHSDVAWRRKIDPGELFDWQRLSNAAIGCWPDVAVTNERIDGLKNRNGWAYLEKWGRAILQKEGVDVKGQLDYVKG